MLRLHDEEDLEQQRRALRRQPPRGRAVRASAARSMAQRSAEAEAGQLRRDQPVPPVGPVVQRAEQWYLRRCWYDQARGLVGSRFHVPVPPPPP